MIDAKVTLCLALLVLGTGMRAAVAAPLDDAFIHLQFARGLAGSAAEADDLVQAACERAKVKVAKAAKSAGVFGQGLGGRLITVSTEQESAP